MEFRILGPLEIFDESRPVSVHRGKEQALLAFLLLHANEPVASERLIDELWGERPPATAPKILQNAVSQLRKALGDGRLVTRPPGYLLRLAPGELDLDRFQQLAREGRAHGDPARPPGLRARGLPTRPPHPQPRTRAPTQPPTPRTRTQNPPTRPRTRRTPPQTTTPHRRHPIPPPPPRPARPRHHPPAHRPHPRPHQNPHRHQQTTTRQTKHTRRHRPEPESHRRRCPGRKRSAWSCGR